VCCPGSARRRRSPVYGDEIVEFGERWLLRTGLLKAGRMAWNEQAHHLIPLQLRLRPVVQAAARVGFDMNAPLNGIGLPRWRVLARPTPIPARRARWAAILGAAAARVRSAGT
jgi:A nuclease family of the HNH/ENDO VII superfamily with conserved AHH